MFIIPYFNGALTSTEEIFNVLGYIPKHICPKLNVNVTRLRRWYGTSQLITGLALATLGYLIELLTRQNRSYSYLSLSQQALCLGLLYANHGVLNIIRSYIEKQGLGSLTAVYDFYGRKILPPLSLSFSFQTYLFNFFKQKLDRIHFVTLFPPQILIQSV